MAQAVILIGLQGSGKTSYFNAHLAGTHAHISRDVLRTAEREAALVSDCIRSGRSFVSDNTNGTRVGRARLIEQAKAAGFTVHAYFFDVPVRTAMGRNNHRTDKKAVPIPAILRTAKYLEHPSTDEGFDEIRTIPLQLNTGGEQGK